MKFVKAYDNWLYEEADDLNHQPLRITVFAPLPIHVLSNLDKDLDAVKTNKANYSIAMTNIVKNSNIKNMLDYLKYIFQEKFYVLIYNAGREELINNNGPQISSIAIGPNIRLYKSSDNRSLKNEQNEMVRKLFTLLENIPYEFIANSFNIDFEY